MKKNTIENYRVISLDRNGRGEEGSYKNPLTKVFQYEYALFLAVADLFGSVRCRSMCVERLKLYYMETRNREDLQKEMKQLVDRDVTGAVNFPMMHICAAEVKTIREKDGTHSFVFTDGIYGFRLRLSFSGKGRPERIEVTDPCA